jgi:adenine-specific DNA-methyltransferase
MTFPFGRKFSERAIFSILIPRNHYQPIIDHLNALPGKDGWFTEHYGGEPNGGSSVGEDNLKKPWQKHNTRRLDAIREEIERLSLSETEKAVLLTSLIFALDEVDSTLGHFASYLNDWSPRSYNELHLKFPGSFRRRNFTRFIKAIFLI